MTETVAHPRVMPWEQFIEMFRREHRQGEHVAIVGPTGSGKTVLGLQLCQAIAQRRTKGGRPASVVVLATKPRDDTVQALVRSGKERGEWQVIKEWPPGYDQEHCVVWVRGSTASTAAREQAAVYRQLLDTIYREGGQTVYIDEAAYFERRPPGGLGLTPTMEQYWMSARGMKVTMIAGTQRPRHVSVSMWTEPSWVFIFPVHDRDDLKRVADLSGRRDEVLDAVSRLGGHEFLVVRRQPGGARSLYVSKVS